MDVVTLTEYAGAGNAAAQFYLGVAHYLGIMGAEVDRPAAIHWWCRAAEGGWGEAQFMLGQCYHFGTDLPRDVEQAAHWFECAAAQGHLQAQINLAAMLLSGTGVTKDSVRAAGWLRKAMESGSAAAAVSLGRLYEEGEGVAPDAGLAEACFKAAADLGDLNGQYSYALSLRTHPGTGPGQVAERTAAGNEWLVRAATQGHPLAQFELGRTLLHGDGVERDAERAAEWLENARTAGLAPAAHLLGVMAVGGMATHRSPREGADLVCEAARANCVEAQLVAGMLLYQGTVLERDLQGAVKWFRAAAESGATHAKFMLGLIYLNDLARPEEALRWTREAAEEGCAEAQYSLAWQLWRGEGAPADPADALAWFRRVAVGTGELAEQAAAAVREITGAPSSAPSAPPVSLTPPQLL